MKSVKQLRRQLHRHVGLYAPMNACDNCGLRATHYLAAQWNEQRQRYFMFCNDRCQNEWKEKNNG